MKMSDLTLIDREGHGSSSMRIVVILDYPHSNPLGSGFECCFSCLLASLSVVSLPERFGKKGQKGQPLPHSN